MIEKIFGKVIDFPKITLCGILLLTMVWALFIPNLTIDFSIEHLFSQNDPAVEEYFSFRDDFGREDNVITIIYEPVDYLDRELYKELENIAYALEELNGVENVVSIFSLSDLDTKHGLETFIIAALNGTKTRYYKIEVHSIRPFNRFSDIIERPQVWCFYANSKRYCK